MQFERPKYHVDNSGIDEAVLTTLEQVRKQFPKGQRFVAADFVGWIKTATGKEFNAWAVGRALNRLSVDIADTKYANKTIYLL